MLYFKYKFSLINPSILSIRQHHEENSASFYPCSKISAALMSFSFIYFKQDLQAFVKTGDL